MNTQKHLIKTLTLTSTLAVALAVMTWVSTQTQAAEPVKGGQKLVQLNQIKTVGDIEALKPGDLVAMACAKCKSIWVTYVDKEAKGGAILNAQGEPTKLEAKHQCPGCKSTIEVIGHGKEKHDAIKHVCQSCGDDSAFCCAAKAGSTTKGMEKK